eukprot:CAMPEP_0172181358 /NCGR_PEP_ID=MMETSP1050-20130122/17770_1 /TAXON_ID=233186 /ORGANISM="Cryptomonas curvata, Strain CCAP979/52" /LENGTH=184 /DNA_ID=CAMNT_0012854625 /DNA_START=23 /DNA_END=573 /DNA_ORIENTATION=-
MNNSMFPSETMIRDVMNSSDLHAAATSSGSDLELPNEQASVFGYFGLDIILERVVTSTGLQIDMTTSLIEKAIWVLERHRVGANNWETKASLICSAIFLVLVAGRTLNSYLRPSLTSQIICLWLSLMWASQAIAIFENTCTKTPKWPVEGFATVLLFAAQSLVLTLAGSQRLITFHRASLRAHA